MAMERFRNKYRIQSARAQWWDYGWNGAYFITICTHNRVPYFGEIVAGKMNLSKTGVIADLLWYQIPNHAPFVELGEFVVMPNHIHGILILDKSDDGNRNRPGDGNDPGKEMTETLHATSLSNQSPHPPQSKNEKMAAISPKSNTVSTIVRSYKSAVTKHANRLGLPNGWQPRFHDHIIRNDADYQRVSDYIVKNPANWQDDKYYES
jgi:putative transposase